MRTSLRCWPACQQARWCRASVDLENGAWTLERGRPAAACERTVTTFTSIHGPRWRMLVIGASEIARYLADMAAPLDFQAFLCDPREEYRASWRVPGHGLAGRHAR